MNRGSIVDFLSGQSSSNPPLPSSAEATTLVVKAPDGPRRRPPTDHGARPLPGRQDMFARGAVGPRYFHVEEEHRAKPACRGTQNSDS